MLTTPDKVIISFLEIIIVVLSHSLKEVSGFVRQTPFKSNNVSLSARITLNQDDQPFNTALILTGK